MQRATKRVVQTRSEGPLLEPWEQGCVSYSGVNGQRCLRNAV